MVIEKEELRIGNILEDRNGDVCEVIEIDKEGFKAVNMSSPITALPIIPKDIEKGFLESVGFSEVNENIYTMEIVDQVYLYFNFKTNTGGLATEETEIDNEGNYNQEVVIVDDEINYVHQLQNLFYVLVGCELTPNWEEVLEDVKIENYRNTILRLSAMMYILRDDLEDAEFHGALKNATNRWLKTVNNDLHNISKKSGKHGNEEVMRLVRRFDKIITID